MFFCETDTGSSTFALLGAVRYVCFSLGLLVGWVLGWSVGWLVGLLADWLAGFFTSSASSDRLTSF